MDKNSRKCGKKYQNKTAEPEYHYKKGRITIFTDGSLKDGEASIGVYIGPKNQRNRALPCDGIQEINNAELKAVLTSIKMCKQEKEIEIISDSLNSVKFVQRAIETTDRVIRRELNSTIKLRIKRMILERNKEGQKMSIKHVRSHADDQKRKDHQKRMKENKKNFRWRSETVQRGNKGADKLAEKAKGPRLENEPKGEEKFYIIMEGLEYIDNIKIAIREKQNLEITKEWYKKQPSRSEFDRIHPEKQSKPKKKMNFANKVYTGTICCNKRKYIMKMTKTDKCIICRSKEMEAVDDHKHALEGCTFTKERGDTLWNKIQIKWKELKVKLVSIKPWFSTKNNGTERYSINKRNCDRGLIPKEIFPRLKKRNPKIDIKLVKKITSSTVKYHIIETFLARKELEKNE
jgi:hypothetical protein